MLGTEEQIIEEYVKTGKVKLVYWHILDFGPPSQAASEAAECAGEQGRFWEMHRILFEEQDRMWSNPRQTALELAKRIPGLDLLDIGKFKFGKAPAAMIERCRQKNQPRRGRRLAGGSQAQGTTALPWGTPTMAFEDCVAFKPPEA